MGSIPSMSTRWTTRPSGPVWCVTSLMPSIFLAISKASAVSLAGLDAATLAPAAGVNLGLDDHAPAQPLGGRHGLFGSVDHLSVRHGDAVLRQDGLGLILMDFHRKCLC